MEGTFPPADGRPAGPRARTVKEQALDLLLGLLPAASLSHIGIYATGQAYERLILHLLAPPTAGGPHYGEGILDENRAVMPASLRAWSGPTTAASG